MAGKREDTNAAMRGRALTGANEPAQERKSRIGALKQQLTQSDEDMARLEHHIRGLLVKSKGQCRRSVHDSEPHLHSLPLPTGQTRQSGTSVPPASTAGTLHLPALANASEGSPWGKLNASCRLHGAGLPSDFAAPAVLQVPDDADELRPQLEGAWRENERLKARELADRLTIEDLRQKLVASSQHATVDSQNQVKNRESLGPAVQRAGDSLPNAQHKLHL